LKWHISDDEINEELDRQDKSNISFVFIIKWFQRSITLNQSSKPASLLKYLASPEPVPLYLMDKVKSEKEILAMCYFNFLEERGFLGQDSEYLFGNLLKLAVDYDQSVLVLLEMLKIFYPAGLPLTASKSHEEYAAKWDPLASQPHITEGDKSSIRLLSRLFSIFTPKNLIGKGGDLF
jgi:hypothetical protein